MRLLLLFTVRACLPYPKILYFIHTCEKMWFLKGNTPPRRARWESSQKTFSIRKFIEFGRVPTRFKRNIFQTVSWKRDFFYAMSEKHFLLIIHTIFWRGSFYFSGPSGHSSFLPRHLVWMFFCVVVLVLWLFGFFVLWGFLPPSPSVLYPYLFFPFKLPI